MHRRVCLIPLDSRPVCYDLPRRLAEMAGLELCMPSPKLLGSPAGKLKQPGDFKALQRWVKNHLVENDPVIAALDTVVYGGLIPSRISEDPRSVLEERLEKFFQTVRATQLLGFSSILRIPNYNNAEEEPDYWRTWGKDLYAFSAKVHQEGAFPLKPTDQYREVSTPSSILADFLSRREKNFQLNRKLVDYLNQGKLDYLVFCQDDTGPYGLNVYEAKQLQAQLKENPDASIRSHVQTGADEVAACLLARWMGQNQERTVSIYPFYSSDTGKKLVAKFDGLPIESVVSQQIRACGAKPVKKSADADVWLIVHTPHTRQGDHCENQRPILDEDQTEHTLQLLKKAFDLNKPVILADVAYANGSDPALTAKLIQTFPDLMPLYGYAGWNTPGNTLGSAIATGVIRLLAEERGRFQPEAFRQVQLIRFADDWLYQSDVRYQMRKLTNGKPPDEAMLNVTMANGLALLQQRLKVDAQSIRCRFPCKRTFEIEVAVQ